jgi:hypothetical protein
MAEKKVSITTTSIGLTTSKLVALCGALITIIGAVAAFGTGGLAILGGILGLVFAVFIFVSLQIVEIKKFKLPYEWWLLLVFGVVLVLLSFWVGGSLLGGLVLIIAALLEVWASKKNISASRFVCIIGGAWTLYDGIFLFIAGGAGVVSGVIGIILGVFLLISILVKGKIPFEWWTVLLIGFVLTYLLIGFNMSGTIILIGFLLMLVAA